MADFRARIIEELPHLRRYARALTNGRADAADDLVQSCVERALSRQSYWSPGGSFRSWLFAILHNIFVNDATTAARRSAILRAKPPSETSAAPDQETSLEVRDVLDAIALLPDEHRAALCLVALEDVSYAEAAQILDVPVGTLMSRLHRARARLKELTGADGRPRLRRVK